MSSFSTSLFQEFGQKIDGPTTSTDEPTTISSNEPLHSDNRASKKEEHMKDKIQEKLARLEDLKRQQNLLQEEINQINCDIGEELIDSNVTLKSSFVVKRLVTGNYTHENNVHVMVIPVAEAIEKQLMVLLKDRRKDLKSVFNVIENNMKMMEDTVSLVKDLVEFGSEQVSLVFGEKSVLNQMFISGVMPFLNNIDNIFNALENLLNFKRNSLDTFLSDKYDRNKLLKNIGDIAVKDVLPAKLNFTMRLLNNSDNIRQDLDHMMYHMTNLVTLKQSVIDSVYAYIEQIRGLIQNNIGREFRFDTFFKDLQTGHLLTNITVGPFAKRGVFFNKKEAKSIIKHYISTINPRLPILESSVKEILVDKDQVQIFKGPFGQEIIDDWLSKRFSDIIVESFYRFSVNNGDIVSLD